MDGMFGAEILPRKNVPLTVSPVGRGSLTDIPLAR